MVDPAPANASESSSEAGGADVVDLLLDPTGRLLTTAVPSEQAMGIVRLDGVPVGRLEEVGPASQLGQRIFDRLGSVLADHLVRRRLAEGTFPDRQAPSPPGATQGTSLRSLTVAICTRDRPDDLAGCLASIDRVDYPGALDVLVVENAPQTSAVADLIRARHPHVRYVQEPCPGLNWARRRAVAESTGEVVAFVDDDVVVDRGWARAIAAPFAECADVMMVSGLVVPLELETPAQRRFERLDGLGKGFVRRWHRRPRGAPTAPLYGNAGPLGIGANMAFRRAIFESVGSFDPALGAGTPSGGGDDLDLLFRVLKAGHTLVYEPAAFVRHRHRRADAELEAQMRSWCTGMLAFLCRTMAAYPDERRALAALAARLLVLYYPRRLIRSLADPRLPPRLALAEIVGAVRGPWRYRRARARARELAVLFDRPLDDLAARHPMTDVRSLAPSRTIAIDLDVPLPATLPGPDEADTIVVQVTMAGRTVGAVSIVSGGHPVTRGRLADALADQLRLDARGAYRERLRQALVHDSRRTP